MTEDAPTCLRCGRPMRHETAVVCGHCGTHLRAQLARAARLAEDVQTTVARLDRITRTGGGETDDLGWWSWWRAGDEPDPRRPGTNLAVRIMTERSALEPVATPARLEASLAYDAAYGELSTWARHCCETRGIFYVGDPGLETLCAFLAGQVDWLRYRDEADEACKAIEMACRNIERIVDRGPERVVVGRCPCGTWLYAVAGADAVICEGCGTSYDVEASRQQLRDDLEDRLMTGAQIATMAVHLGLVKARDKARNAIKLWAQRGRIAAHGQIDGDPAYRFGDTVDLLIEAYARAA